MPKLPLHCRRSVHPRRQVGSTFPSRPAPTRTLGTYELFRHQSVHPHIDQRDSCSIIPKDIRLRTVQEGILDGGLPQQQYLGAIFILAMILLFFLTGVIRPSS